MIGENGRLLRIVSTLGIVRRVPLPGGPAAESPAAFAALLMRPAQAVAEYRHCRREMAVKPDEDLEEFEERLRVLKNKYDQFFPGIRKMPPITERRSLDVTVHEMSKEKMRDNTRRFRFNTILSRYNQYREMWARRTREREEGPMEFKKRSAALAAALPEETRI